MPKKPPFDFEALPRLQRMGGNSLVLKIIDLFFQNGPEKVREAQHSWEVKDWQSLERAVHSLKSSAGNIGARRLQNIANEIENQASRRQAEPLPALFQRLEDAFQKTVDYLTQERAKYTL